MPFLISLTARDSTPLHLSAAHCCRLPLSFEVLFLGVPLLYTLVLYYLQRLGFSVLRLWYEVCGLGPYVQPHPLS